MKQLETWQGEFGNAYTDRNQIDWQIRLPAFQKMVQELTIHRVLEVGCNRGHNLLALAEILGDGSEVVGIEPNRYALAIARSASVQVGVLYGHAFDLPFKNDYFDLVFSAGVLIHIPPAHLPEALTEIYRVSKRYLLSIEYFAEEETVIYYRDHEDLLWKRNFLRHWQTQFPDLRLIRTGYWGREDGFDRTHWWLLEKGVYLEERPSS
ncbi:MAG: pseudaminic acid biosynthesis-associated methylase [Thermodesulfobacteriota bacterium]|jgi:pseudaminic acid biosynthesis-associated methylase